MDAGTALAAHRAELLAAAARIRSDIAGIVAASVNDNADDEHDPEGATIAFERAQLAAVLDSTMARVAEVDAALARVAAGSYGICSVCGAPIGQERLAVRPAATKCVICS